MEGFRKFKYRVSQNDQLDFFDNQKPMIGYNLLCEVSTGDPSRLGAEIGEKQIPNPLELFQICEKYLSDADEKKWFIRKHFLERLLNLSHVINYHLPSITTYYDELFDPQIFERLLKYFAQNNNLFAFQISVIAPYCPNRMVCDVLQLSLKKDGPIVMVEVVDELCPQAELNFHQALLDSEVLFLNGHLVIKGLKSGYGYLAGLSVFPTCYENGAYFGKGIWYALQDSAQRETMRVKYQSGQQISLMGSVWSPLRPVNLYTDKDILSDLKKMLGKLVL